METLEHSAQIYLVARMLGSAQPLSEEHVAKLQQIRQRCQPPRGSCLGCQVLEDRVQTISSRLTPQAPGGTYQLTREELIDLITDVVRSM